MRREEALAALRGYLPVIRRDFGVRRIALFGSTARGDAREDSDLDILVDRDRPFVAHGAWVSHLVLAETVRGLDSV